MNALNAIIIASDHHHDAFPWFPLIPAIFLSAWIAIIITARRRWRNCQPSGEAVLAERFARGEIDEAEYRQRRDVLRQKR